MNNIVFARPRHEYGSYADFWRVVKLWGFPICYLDQVDWSQGNLTVIATPKNAEWVAIPDRHNARLVWWSIERMANADDLFDMANPYVPRCVDEVWTSDGSIARLLHWRYVFLGGHPDFANAEPLAKQYDIVTLMAPLPRRTRLLDELKVFTNADTGNLWGVERDLRLRQSRLMVMCHQDEQAICEPPRMMVGGCYMLPMLCETSKDAGYWIAGQNCLMSPLETLSEQAALILQHKGLMARIGAAAWRLTCQEHPFRQEVEASL